MHTGGSRQFRKAREQAHIRDRQHVAPLREAGTVLVVLLAPLEEPVEPGGPLLPRGRAGERRGALEVGSAGTAESVGWQNFGKMLLVFGCIGSDFYKKICVLQHFSKSTRFSS